MMYAFVKSRRAQSKDDYETWLPNDKSNTLNTFDVGDIRATTVICMATQQGGAEIAVNLCPTITAAAGMSGNNQPIVCIEGNGSRPSHFGDGYRESDVMYTLNTIDRHAVAYDARGNGGGGVVNTITGDHENRITDYTSVVVSVEERRAQHEDDCEGADAPKIFGISSFGAYKESVETLRASGGDLGGGSENLLVMMK